LPQRFFFDGVPPTWVDEVLETFVGVLFDTTLVLLRIGAPCARVAPVPTLTERAALTGRYTTTLKPFWKEWFGLTSFHSATFAGLSL